MLDKIKIQLVTALMQMLLSTLTPELVREFLQKTVESALKFAEEKVLGSASTVDDKLLLPLIAVVREVFEIKK
jgi:hypothetical protein